MSVDFTQSKYYKLFKSYDLRGPLGDGDQDLFYWVGYGLVETILKPENLPLEVVITYDCRSHSEEFAKYLSQGIIDAGGKVKFFGLGATEMMYVATHYYKLPGVQLTASHNPKEDHGAKLLKIGSQMLGIGSGLEKIRDYALDKITENITIIEPSIETDQKVRQEVLDYYYSTLENLGQISQINKLAGQLSKKIRIAVDTGNGMAGMIMPEIQKRYSNIEFVPLYWELDGNFPNHPANPTEYETLKDLQKAVIDGKADWGIAFDGDADRFGIVDEAGEIVAGDFIVADLARTMLEDYDLGVFDNTGLKKAIVYIQPGSRCVPRVITENDGVAIPVKQGHIFVKAGVAEYKALYGGEYSGHHYFGVFGGLESAVLPFCLILKKLIKKQIQNISELYTDLNSHYYISELSSPKIPEGQTWQDWEQKLVSHYSNADRISYLDGIAIYFPDWKFSMRPSNTEPVVRFMVETTGQDRVEAKQKEILAVVGGII